MSDTMDEMSESKKIFMIECSEMLQDMEDTLLILENNPEDEEAVNALFRAAHTIKGSSGLIGCDNVGQFTHVVENLLDRIRDGEVRITTDMIGLLLECKDHISLLIDIECQDGSNLTDECIHKGEELTGKLKIYLNDTALPADTGVENEPVNVENEPVNKDKHSTENDGVESKNWHISLRFGTEVLRNGMDPISFISYLTRLGEIVSLTTLYDSMPEIEEMDPESCYLGFEIEFKSDFNKKEIEDVFEFVREDCAIRIIPPGDKVESYVQLINDLPEDPLRIGEILVHGGALTHNELEDALEHQNRDKAGKEEGEEEERRPIGELLVDAGVVDQKVVDAAVTKQERLKDKDLKTIRVNAEKLDQLINMVGEMVIAGGGVWQHALRIKDTPLLKTAKTMSRLIGDIRENTMQMRMIPIGATFNKFQRIVRDICRESNKEIELKIMGNETELDRVVIEKINDPLTHLIRNAIDHGIEEAEERISKKKPAKGTVELNAYHDAGTIVIEVKDDGRGLDLEKLRKKAVEKGFADAEKNMSDKELLNLIFEPGFSTAEKVTKLSGRGVGMDVVKRNIEALRGFVDIDSEENKGTVMRIHLPLTLSIIDGFMVGVSDLFYVIPLEMIIKCITLTEEDQVKARKLGYVDFNDKPIPYLCLVEMFSENGVSAECENIVIVRYADQQAALAVDRLYGEVQAVIKSLGKVYGDVHSISGATILGDGTVALIIDVPSIIKSV